MKAPKISISIGADTARLKRDMKKADGIVGKFTTAAKYGLASATAAAGAFAFKLGVDGVQAAIADEASQVKLATALQNTTKATDAQIASVEDYITKTQMRYGVEDVLLRNSLNKLATVTGDVTKAQEMQSIALDVAAGSGLSLEQATLLITKALQGSFTGFKKLGVVLDDNITKNKDGAAAVEVLATKYVGAADKAANTTKGKLDRLNQAWDETVEGVGEALLPALEDVADWATSPEGAKALQDFLQDFQSALATTADWLGRIGDLLDNITPDKNTWLGSILSNNTQKGVNDINVGAVKAQRAFEQNTNRFIMADPRTQPVTININGAIDPVATARQVKKILNAADRQGVSNNAGTRGN